MKKILILFILLSLVSCKENVTENVNHAPEDDEITQNVSDAASENKKAESSDDTPEEVAVIEDNEESTEDAFIEFKVMTTADVLNIRSANDIDSDLIGQVPYGEIYVVKEVLTDNENRDWYRIDFGGKDGWIAGWFTYGYYEVSTLPDFVDAIGSDRIIKLTPDMAEVDFNYDEIVNLNEHLNGRTISNVSNMIIEGDIDETVKLYTSSTASVISFEACSNIVLRGLDIGHIVNGPCNGNVVNVIDCENILIENNILFGCGRIGIDIVNSDVKVTESKIHDCYLAGFSVDLKSTLLIDNCVLTGLPSAFYDVSYSTIEDNVKINDTLIDTPIVPSPMYSDRLFIEGVGIYKMYGDYNGISLDNSICIPRGFDENASKDEIVELLKSLDVTEVSRVKAIPVADNKFGLDIEIDYNELESLSKDEIERIIKALLVKMKDSESVSYGHIFGTLSHNNKVAAKWTYNEELVLDYVYYPYTGEFLGVESIDFDKYLDEMFGIELMVRSSGIEIEILPSVLESGELIHRAAFDLVSYAGDFDEYLGTMMLLTYNQTADSLAIQIDGAVHNEMPPVSGQAQAAINDISKMQKILRETDSFTASGFEYVYKLREEDLSFVKGVIENRLSKKMQAQLQESEQLIIKDSLIYSKNGLHRAFFVYDGYEPTFIIDNKVYIYSIRDYLDPLLLVMIEEEAGYRFDSQGSYELIARDYENIDPFFKWVYTIYQYY